MVELQSVPCDVENKHSGTVYLCASAHKDQAR